MQSASIINMHARTQGKNESGILPVDRVGVTKFAGYTKAAELLQYRGEIKPGIDNLSTV